MQTESVVINVDVSKATAKQLRDFLKHTLQDEDAIKKHEKSNADQIRSYIIGAGYPKKISIVQLPEGLALTSQEPESEEWDGKDETERWCKIRAHAEQGRHNNRMTPIPLANGDFSDCYLPREVTLLVRERLFYVLDICKPILRHQNMDEHGVTVGKFADATVTQTHRYPFTFYRYYGKVVDGDPRKEYERDPLSSEYVVLVTHRGMSKQVAMDLARQNNEARTNAYSRTA